MWTELTCPELGVCGDGNTLPHSADLGCITVPIRAAKMEIRFRTPELGHGIVCGPPMFKSAIQPLWECERTIEADARSPMHLSPRHATEDNTQAELCGRADKQSPFS